jgi:hypothetical protein
MRRVDSPCRPAVEDEEDKRQQNQSDERLSEHEHLSNDPDGF